MTFDELKTALLANEVSLKAEHLRAFGRDESDALASIAADYREQSHMRPLPEWAQEQGLDCSALVAIAENYSWAAQWIDRLTAA